MHNACDFCERIYIDHRGWLKLLDMENILCRREDKLEVVEIDTCQYCDQFEWADSVTNALQWEQRYQEDLIEHAINNQYQFEDCGEYESDLY
jgi:hypothetical protein